MRVLACCFLFSICLFAQGRESLRLFPIPEGLDKAWPDAILSDSEKNLLREAVEPDLRDLEKHCVEKSKFDNLNKTSVALGKLGKGIIVAMRGSCSCGATGNCATYLYIREKGRYREVLREGNRFLMAGPSPWSIRKPMSPTSFWPKTTVPLNSGS
jgi:hypothetical protein